MDDLTPHVITSNEAKRMSRWEVIQTLLVAGDDEERHLARLLNEGPTITEEEEAKLLDWIPLPRPIDFAVGMALSRMARG